LNIINFTPVPAFLGGILIGLAVIIFLVGNGRLAGISGIVDNLFFSKNNRLDNILFIVGVILGPIIYSVLTKSIIPFSITTSIPVIILGGFFVGIGTKIGSGCTSGHGICGISRFSIRSIVATLVFLTTGVLTVLVMRII
tara:strand:+ start:246 stop:665 length:420 start_codon:yes stop_codon:yes gene_type:complete